jgi:hypothetical protein
MGLSGKLGDVQESTTFARDESEGRASSLGGVVAGSVPFFQVLLVSM